MNNLITRDRTAISAWLLLCILLVICMVLVGGYTRLSGSGLSITEWKPIHGALPPLNETQWQEEFTGYKQSPQYRQINSGMTMEEFQGIFWPEFWHRVLGRVTGFVFFVPYLIFIMRKSLSKSFIWRLAGIFALGGLQGAIGWLMVKSGLQDQPYVSPVRLALHLITAFLLLALLIWAWLDVRQRISQPAELSIKPISYYIWFAVLIAQIILGAFMAGLHAGMVYNTWPDMNGEFIPAHELASGQHWLTNLTLIQFLHRNLAIAVALGFGLWWYFYRFYVKNSHLAGLCVSILAVIGMQFSLGVLTLVYQVPLPLALTHQMMAAVLFVLSVGLMHGLRTGSNRLI